MTNAGNNACTRMGDPPTPRGSYAPCAGCGRTKRVHARSLCRGCYDRGEVRAKRPDRRWAVIRLDVEHRNRLLMDPVVCPREVLAKIACDVAQRFGRRVDADDLIQVGWLVLIEAIESHKVEGNGSLTWYARRGLYRDMIGYARKDVRLGTLGSGGVEFDVADRRGCEAEQGQEPIMCRAL